MQKQGKEYSPKRRDPEHAKACIACSMENFLEDWIKANPASKDDPDFREKLACVSIKIACDAVEAEAFIKEKASGGKQRYDVAGSIFMAVADEIQSRQTKEQIRGLGEVLSTLFGALTAADGKKH